MTADILTRRGFANAHVGVGHPPGTVRRLIPEFSTDFPPSLAAHDIGLKDLLDSFYMLGDEPPEH